MGPGPKTSAQLIQRAQEQNVLPNPPSGGHGRWTQSNANGEKGEMIKKRMGNGVRLEMGSGLSYCLFEGTQLKGRGGVKSTFYR